MMTSPLEIHLLGPVEILYQGKPVEINRRMERAILYILAAEQKPISRTTLIDLFWPDDDQINTRRALRTALSRLRNELPLQDLLLTELDQVGLDLQKCRVDLVRFSQLYRSLQHILSAFHESRGLPAQIAHQVQEALDLWRAETIILGDDLTPYPRVEAWRQSLDKELNQNRRLLMRKLGKHYQASGRPEQALEQFIQLGRMDPLDVSLHLTILKILTSLGRHQEVIDYCDSLEVIYEEQYNLTLPDQILSQYQYSQIQFRASKEKKPQEWPTALTMQLQLIGRQIEVEQLQNAYYQGGVIVVKGELGSGKTRLVKELFMTLSPRPFLFLAPAIEMENILPLSPIIHGLRHHVTEDIWQEVDEIWANQISLMLPEILNIRKDLDPSQYSVLPPGKQYLFDALRHVFHLITTNKGRMLFFLDDAQWADKQTLQAIKYISLHGFFESHGLLVIAYRPEEPNPDLDEMIDQLYRSASISIINLNGLSPDDLNLLAQQVFESQPSMAFIAQLYRETNGNPFLALEIIRDILDRPEDTASFESHLPLPESVHALIRQRLKRMAPESRHLLLCAAVIGGNFPADFLLSIADMDNPSEIDAIEPLVEAGFVHMTGEDESGWVTLQFGHEKMREVILKEASPLKLQLLHQQVAEYLQTTSRCNAKSSVIARHYLTAGEIKHAFDWLLKAAKYAWTLGAKEDAINAYHQAEKLLQIDEEGIFIKKDIFKLYKEWSNFAYEANIIEMMEETGVKLQNYGEKWHDPLMIGFSHIALANASFLRIKMDSGLKLIEKAIKNLEKTGNREALIQAIARKGACHWWKNQFNETIQAANTIVDISETIEIDSPEMLSHRFYARHMIGMSLYAKGNAKATLAYAQETYDRFYSKINSFNRMRMLNMMAFTHLISAKYKTCEHFVNLGFEITHALDNAFVNESLLMILARIEIIQGHLDEAYIHSTELLRLGEQSNRTHVIVGANSLLGDIFNILQNYSKALQFYRLAQVRAGTSNQSIQRIGNDLQLARLLSLMGQQEEAQEIIQKIHTVTRKAGMMQLYSLVLSVSGFYKIFVHDLDEALTAFQKSAEMAVQNGLQYEHVWTMIGRCRIALSKRQFDLAEEYINDVLEESQRLNTVWQKLHGLQLCSELHKATQRPTLKKYRKMFTTLMEEFEAHTQSDPLKKDFLNAKRLWEEGHHYP